MFLKMYQVGQYEERPWGSYKVLEVGTNYCKKEIIVQPGKILSLQSHNYRKECWIVKYGTLEVMVDTKQMILNEGDSVEISVGVLHCMANLSHIPCVVEELQTGICKEDDIIRYADNYGRTNVEQCIHMYNELKQKL